MQTETYKRTLKLRRWLTAIVLLLLAPLLLFAGLWLRQTLSALDGIDRNLAGLSAIANLEPALRKNVLGQTSLAAPTQLDPTGKLRFSPGALKQAYQDYSNLVNAGDIKATITAAREVTRLVIQTAGLPNSSRPATSTLLHISSDSLLTILLEANSVVTKAVDLTKREDLNVWDKMSVSVKGGKYKLAADEVHRLSLDSFPLPTGPAETRLRDLATVFQKRNIAFQNSAANMLTSVIKSEHGRELILGSLPEDFPALAGSVLDLWHGSLDYLRHDLQQTRKAKQSEVHFASMSGGLIILFALGLVVFYSRQLVEQTDETLGTLAVLDVLTGLGNRHALMKRMQTLSAQEEEGYSGLLHLDLRRFRAINTRYGEVVGDGALRKVAEILKNMVGPDDLVVRAGGAEFIILFPHISHPDKLERLAERISHSLGMERMVHGHALRLDASIGLSLAEHGEIFYEHILTDASIALRNAKAKGSSGICLFSPHMRQHFERSNEIVKDVLEALDNGLIIPWFQPQVCARTGRILGAEALVRWCEKDGTVRHPASFLPAVEEAGYMNKLDETVRRAALSAASRLTRSTPGVFHIGLNISAEVLSEPDCVDRLAQEVRTAGLSPHQVSIEILEAVMLDRRDSHPILVNVKRLSELGFYMELDDFGTGHASIASLRDLKIDRVKIDRSFVAGVDHNKELQTFTRALIQLARSLGISVLAEGVETRAESAWLAENGCDVVQGYYFARPMEYQSLRQMVAEQPFVSEFNVRDLRPMAPAS